MHARGKPRAGVFELAPSPACAPSCSVPAQSGRQNARTDARARAQVMSTHMGPNTHTLGGLARASERAPVSQVKSYLSAGFVPAARWNATRERAPGGWRAQVRVLDFKFPADELRAAEHRHELPPPLPSHKTVDQIRAGDHHHGQESESESELASEPDSRTQLPHNERQRNKIAFSCVLSQPVPHQSAAKEARAHRTEDRSWL